MAERHRSRISALISNAIPVLALAVSVAALYQTARMASVDKINRLRAEQRVVLVTALQKIDNWRLQLDAVERKAQPSIDQTAILWDRIRDKTKTRDYLYQELLKIIDDVHEKNRAEGLEIAHIDLYRVDSKLHDLYLSSYRTLLESRDGFEHSILDHVTDVVFKSADEDMQDPERLGNLLRKSLKADIDAMSMQMDPPLKTLSDDMIGEFRLLADDR